MSAPLTPEQERRVCEIAAEAVAEALTAQQERLRCRWFAVRRRRLKILQSVLKDHARDAEAYKGPSTASPPPEEGERDV